MSNNPYDNTNDPNAGLPPQMQTPQKSGMSGGKIALIIFGILGVIALICCICGIGSCYMGTAALGSAIKQQFGDDPVIQEQLGGIDSASMNFSATQAETGGGGDAKIVFDVTGPNGKGQLIVSDQVGNEFQSAILRMDDGREYTVR